MQVQLLTAEGEHVAHVEIPSFELPPDVLLWGDRSFKHQGNTKQFFECSCYVVPLEAVIEPPAEDE